MLRNQPLLNDEHIFSYTYSRTKPHDATPKKKKRITINQKESQLKQEYSKWTKWFIIVFETGCICDLVLSSLKSFHYYAFLNVDHAVRINIHNNKFISEHKKLIRTFRRSVVSSDYVSHGVAPNSISVSQIPKLIANLKKTIE